MSGAASALRGGREGRARRERGRRGERGGRGRRRRRRSGSEDCTSMSRGTVNARYKTSASGYKKP
eukprot:11607320-Alexandrium_andersonii.AAC.1